jgi:fructose-bisphosphate aldolase class II/tagatose 1,6-diphosphate aldolase GatY/KbaY
MKLQEKLSQYQSSGRAILAANFYNYETLAGILKAAKAENEPVILQLSESSINYLGLEIAAKLARAGLSQFGVEGWLHLDHGATPELAKRCLDAGFDSVMIDGSEKAYEENIRMTSQVLKWQNRMAPTWKQSWDSSQNWDRKMMPTVSRKHPRPANLLNAPA